MKESKQYTQKKELRQSKIRARNSLSEEERQRRSISISEKIASSEVYKKAKTVLIYRAVKGEAQLEALETMPESEGKRLVYPLCISDSRMIALIPQDEHAWEKGRFGIMEPVRRLSCEVEPEEIDLVICPCTVFDENCGRMGMGAGFYDHYLEKCVNAYIAAAAFEVQKTRLVPMESWDKPMDMVFTEKRVYIRHHHEDRGRSLL